jgi:phage-related protein
MVSIARAEKTIVLATSLNEDLSGLDLFLRAAKERVDVILRFEERHSSTRLFLEKHPTCSTGSLLLKQPTPRVLEEFLEVTRDG